MCRNHRGFVEATVACSKLGAHALYLNTTFAGPQIADVVEREDASAIVYDEEFAELVADGGARAASASSPGASRRRRRRDAIRLLEDLIAAGDPAATRRRRRARAAS